MTESDQGGGGAMPKDAIPEGGGGRYPPCGSMDDNAVVSFLTVQME